MFAFIELSGEVMISSCSMVVRKYTSKTKCLFVVFFSFLTSDCFTDRYFRWNASTAGLIVASLGALVLPAHFIVERASHMYSERLILKVRDDCTYYVNGKWHYLNSAQRENSLLGSGA
jgi:hypothetical protein